MIFIIPEREGPPIEEKPRSINELLASTRLCPCGRVFTPYRSFQRYCCDSHRVKYSKGKPSNYRKKPVVEKQCKQCGKTFKTNDGKRNYCSKKCYEAHEVDRHIEKEERVCLVCGVTFVTSHWLKRYCSKECRMKARTM
jgi:hypothetical protein